VDFFVAVPRALRYTCLAFDEAAGRGDAIHTNKDRTMNRRLGWSLLVLAFAVAAGLDPWSLSERDPAALIGSARMAVRHAQAVVLGMAFLQLIVADVLAGAALGRPARAAVALLTGVGAVVYVAGYGLVALTPAWGWLAAAGAALNFLGFAALAGSLRRDEPPALRVVLLVFCFGMLLDVGMGLFAADPGRFLPDYLGTEDGVRLRMLRLARAAVIALSLLTLLLRGLVKRRGASGAFARLGPGLLLPGAVLMPLTLALAAFTSVGWKYLLPLPALAAFLGTLAAVALARPPARVLERAGWLLVAVSMAAGLFMGLYAFDGPFAAPAFLGGYNDFVRRLSRLGHAYGVVLGLACIVVARDLDRTDRETPVARAGVRVLAAGIALTLLGTVAEAVTQGPTLLLGVGPPVIAVGLLLARPPWRA
jgi:hypothetical protein